MKLSAYAPISLLKLVLGEPLAKRLHENLRDNLRGKLGTKTQGFNVDPGSFADNFAYALAIAAATGARMLERAADQDFAEAYDLLPDQEKEHGIVPRTMASIIDRQKVLRARKKISGGAIRVNVENALFDLLGENYVGIHITRDSERALWPAGINDQPQNLQLPNSSRKIVRVLGPKTKNYPPISINLGQPQWVMYDPVDPPGDDEGNHTLEVNDKIIIEPEIMGRTEVVDVSELDYYYNEDIGPKRLFLATFNKAHEKNCVGAVMPWAVWESTQREIVVGVKSVAAVDIEKRREIHELLARTMRSVTSWALVQESSSFYAGPFTTDDPKLGMLDVNPLDLCSFP
jgi:hypothetical protein